MKQKEIILCYKTDRWHSVENRRLIYIGEDKDDCIAQLVSGGWMSDYQAEQIINTNQSQGDNLGYEWDFVYERINSFTN